MNRKIVKESFIANISKKFSMPKTDAKRIVSEFFDFISHNLKEENEVSLSGIGILRVKMASERNIKIPTLNELYKVPKRKKVKFAPSGMILKEINKK